MPRVGFEPTISAGERPKTYALDRAATGTGDATLYNILYYRQCSTCFRRLLRPSSGAQKLYTQHRVYVELACCYG